MCIVYILYTARIRYLQAPSILSASLSFSLSYVLIYSLPSFPSCSFLSALSNATHGESPDCASRFRGLFDLRKRNLRGNCVGARSSIAKFHFRPNSMRTRIRSTEFPLPISLFSRNAADKISQTIKMHRFRTSGFPS